MLALTHCRPLLPPCLVCERLFESYDCPMVSLYEETECILAAVQGLGGTGLAIDIGSQGAHSGSQAEDRNGGVLSVLCSFSAAVGGCLQHCLSNCHLSRPPWPGTRVSAFAGGRRVGYSSLRRGVRGLTDYIAADLSISSGLGYMGWYIACLFWLVTRAWAEL